ncbi:MAG: hypothetical protein ABIG11_02015 [bacterium]
MKKKTYSAWFIALCALFLLFAWENIQATRLGYSVEKARMELQAVRNRNVYLQHRLLSAISPGRVALAARKNLGMVAPEPDQIVKLENETARPFRGWLAKLNVADSISKQ